VHSLDAAHLQAVALRCSEEGLNHLAVIHDSFGTHAADTERLGQILRETFIEQYTDNVLQKFYDELVAQLGEEVGAKLPKPPEVGDLDITQILSASYAFA
jgi:DNA-directed RNA polymerase